jgi:hypothetical protein
MMENNRISYFDFIDDCSKSLAAYGWTFPIQLSPAEINKLVKISHDRLDVDMFFIQHYSHNPNLFRMFKSVYSSELYDRWYKLIEQCMKTYRKGLYLITIPALITVIEGAIANLSRTNRTGIIDLCRERAENIDKSLITRNLWNSFYYFALNLFENKSFDKERPQIINRHWILHGRDSDEWNQADCLRLFQALDTLVNAERSKLKRTFLWKYFDEGSNIP